MMETIKETLAKNFLANKQKTYADIVELLNKNWAKVHDVSTVERMQKLDAALGKPSAKIPCVLIAGTNGKSTAAYFASKLLRAEGLTVGTMFAPHILTYNERIAHNSETISNKFFTDAANEVLQAAELEGIKPSSQEILVMTALVYFVQQNCDVAVIEVDSSDACHPVSICQTAVVGYTRITRTDLMASTAAAQDWIKCGAQSMIKPGAYVVSADQNKNNLSILQKTAKDCNGVWAMPVRKLAALGYPFEQIHGRCAALAERAAQLFIEKTTGDATVISNSLLARPKGQRGRPTLEEKRRSELHPKKTLEQFWKETVSELPCRFQLLEKEKPIILLDNAKNLDAFKNLVLGIRLLHYQRPFKGLALIVAAAKDTLLEEEFLRLIRYFFKKTAGQLFICPLETAQQGTHEYESWDVEDVANKLKTMKVRVKETESFADAFDQAKKAVDERNGLIVVAGSNSIIHQYWKLKGTKKF